MGMPMMPPPAAGPPPEAAGPPISVVITLPGGPEAEQALQVIAEVVTKLGGEIQPEEPDEAAAGQRQAQIGARANRPANLQAPVSPAGPAPMPGGMMGA